MAKKGHNKKGGNKKGGGKGSKYDPSSKSDLPWLSYDPAIEAERRAIQRGLEDTRVDVRRGIHQARTDFRINKKDIRVSKRRGMQDFRQQLQRGLQGLRFERQDVKRDTRRGREDLGLRLEALQREYSTRGQTQLQAANAAGVADVGTLAAAASRRATNFAFERQPIDIGMRRLNQDQITALGRLGVEEHRLRQDTRIGRRRLRQDTRHDLRLSRIEKKRGIGDLRLQKQRAIREATFGNLDLLQQEIFDARTRWPRAFTRSGTRTGQGMPGF